jgi:putative methionine-R-sulfoxide reductase with GAF domain
LFELNLSSEKLVSKFAFKWVNLYRYSVEAIKAGPSAGKVGLVQVEFNRPIA